jgi:ech hydrogenase subunit D
MKTEEQTTEVIEIPMLQQRVKGMLDQGYRLVQIGCTNTGEAYEINYSFDKDYHFENLRVIISPGTELPSVSSSYPGAFVYENEIHDLYGVTVTGMNIDFKGTLYKTSIPTPFGITIQKKDESCQKE